MALTRAERRLQKHAEEIATIAKTDIWDIESYDPDARKAILQLAINTTVIGDVVSKYTLIDELLSVIICNFFFRRSKKDQTFRKLWKTKKFRTFVHYISDEIYLLQKMRIVHAITPLPSQVRSRIEAVNAVRNALAHSFFPENRRQYMAHKKVLYSGEDIRSKEGLAAFRIDFDLIWGELAKRAFGQTSDEASVTV
jgi:hypothetical protein